MKGRNAEGAYILRRLGTVDNVDSNVTCSYYIIRNEKTRMRCYTERQRDLANVAGVDKHLK